ncbi:MAG: outer membrane lipoprotein carrier protein LolA [Bdellovibrionota bacterium]|nr:outer membrane lipoprotein carrier protein LolA [Bdellovibrionota bacterium]
MDFQFKSFKSIFSVVFFLSLCVHMAYSSSIDSIVENQKRHSKTLNDFVDQLKDFKQLNMQVERVSVQSFLGKTKTSNGKMSLTKEGLFWWKIEKPNQSLLVYDGNFAWNEDKLPEDLGGGFKVTKTKHFKSSPAYRVLQVLMGKGDIWKMFSPVRTNDKDSTVELELTPKDKSWNISLLILRFSKDGKNLLSIAYLDELENKTELKFTKMKYTKDVDKKMFSYVPPKDAQITEL